MKKFLYFVLCMTMIFMTASLTGAAPIDVTSDSLYHFATFTNDWPYAPISHISDNTDASSYGDFGLHQHVDNSFPDYFGINLEDSYAVTGLNFQVHVNPFKDFVLQASNNSTTGTDGDWIDIFSSTVTNRSEYSWQEWDFDNTESFSWYRIEINSDYTNTMGWAMYRWELIAEENCPDDSAPVPEPTTILLLGSGLIGLAGFRKKFKNK